MSRKNTKFHAKGKSEKEQDIVELLLSEIRLMATGIYLFLIFVVFPLYLKDHYWEIGFHKWKFFLYTTVPYLAVMLLCALLKGIQLLKNKNRITYSLCDVFVAVYGFCVLFTFGTGSNRQAAWMGAEGWYMGVVAQMLFVLLYFVFSRNDFSVKWLAGCMAVGSAICFIIGILQRMGINVGYLHYGMPDYVIKDFISTIGNRTWYSAYACVVATIGIFLFWHGQSRRDQLIWGIYSAVGFGGLIAANSDSTYAALAVMFVGLLVLSVGCAERLKALCRVIGLFFGTNLLLCFVREIWAKQSPDARGFTRYIYDWRWMAAGLLVSVAAFFLFRLYISRQAGQPAKRVDSDIRDKLQRGCLFLIATGAIVLVILVILNSTGMLEQWFHVTFQNSYLYFDDAWGDARGWTWKKTVEMFKDLPLFHQLFGVGADSFGYYAYTHPVYAQEFSLFWTDEILLNAHNEWLNMVFCQGIVGGVAYLGIFVSAACSCFRKTKECHPLVYAIGLSLIVYMAHNFFGYQQICVTGIVFILLGITQNKSLTIPKS